MMEVFKQITWSKEERHYFDRLNKWMSLCERIEATEAEEKSAARFARGSGERMSEENLTDSIKVWQKIRRLMKQQKADAVKLETNLPDTADGLIARPKQAMICLQEAAIEAMGDIDEVINLVHVGLEILRG